MQLIARAALEHSAPEDADAAAHTCRQELEARPELSGWTRLQSCVLCLEAKIASARGNPALAESLYATNLTDEAMSAIAEARERLLKRADRLDVEAWRHSFLRNVPENARTLQLASAD